jgi:proteasome lid subunit RPN8/RPN11
MEVNIKQRTYERMLLYTKECEYEISGLLLGELEGETDKKITINGIELLEQEVSSGSTVLNIDAVKEWIKNNPNKSARVIGWWHSHAKMQPFISGTDNETSKELSKSRGYIVCIVTSHNSDPICSIILNTAIGFVEVKAKLQIVQDKKIIENIKKEIEQKVKVREIKVEFQTLDQCWKNKNIFKYWMDD